MSTGNGDINGTSSLAATKDSLSSEGTTTTNVPVELAQVENQGKKAVLTSPLDVDYPKSLKKRPENGTLPPAAADQGSSSLRGVNGSASASGAIPLPPPPGSGQQAATSSSSVDSRHKPTFNMDNGGGSRTRKEPSKQQQQQPPATDPPKKRVISPSNLLRRTYSPPDEDTPQVDPHLVATERYDPQSKAFSYVPVQALQDHFKAPKKPTRLVPMFEQVGPPPTAGVYGTGGGGGMGEAYGPPSHVPRPRSTPLNILDNDLLDPNYYLTFTDQDARQQHYASEYANLYNSRLLQSQHQQQQQMNGTTPDIDVEAYQPFGVAKQMSSPAGVSPYGQFRTQQLPSWTDQINDAAATFAPPAEMMTAKGQQSYKGGVTPTPTPVMTPVIGHQHQQPPPVPPKHHKPINVSAYRDHLQSLSSIDGSTSFIKSPTTSVPRTGTPDSIQTRPPYGIDPYAAAYYSRPSSAVPNRKPKPLIDYCHSPTPLSFSTPPPSQSERDKSDWLDKQMQKLKMRQIMNDPEYRFRKEQEKLLLEELKHVHDERMLKNKRQEADYSVEGMGAIKTILDEPPGSELGLNDEISSLFSESRLSEDVFTQQQQHQAPIQLGYTQSLDQSVSARPPAPTKPMGAAEAFSPHHVTPSSVDHRYTYNRGSPSWSKSSEAPSDPYHGYQQHQQQMTQHHVTRVHQPYNQRRPTDFSPLHDFEERYQPPFTSIRSLHSISSPKSILKKPKSLDTQVLPSDNFANRFGSAPNKFLDREHYASEISPDDQFGHSKSFDEVDSFNKFYKKPETPVLQQNVIAQTPLASRAQTPAFPVNLRSDTPLPYHPLLYQRGPSDPGSVGPPGHAAYMPPYAYGANAYPPTPQHSYQQQQQYGQRPFSPSMQYFCSRRSSMQSLLEPMEVVNQHPVFVKDTSKYWYKPTISRDEAINMLKEKPPGTFIIRDSNSFPGAFGLALKVAMPPPGVQTKSNDGSELVRHFLIEPTAKGVKLKGCNNEPVFGSLAALVYQHSITPLALPCKLLLPDYDPGLGADQLNRAQALLEQGAACNVTYLYSYDTESLTGPEAVRKTVDQAIQLSQQKELQVANVHFKVAAQGITVTDNTRKLFFRRHYPVSTVTFCGIDPDERRWNLVGDGSQPARIFGFVARKSANKNENTCHVFAEFEPEQPAAAIVNFVTKVMMASFRSHTTITTTSTMNSTSLNR